MISIKCDSQEILYKLFIIRIALRLKAAYFIIVICKDDLISLERESVGTRGRGLETVGSTFKFPNF